MTRPSAIRRGRGYRQGRRDAHDRDAERVSDRLGRRQADAEAREAARASADNDAREVSLLRFGFVHQLIDALEQLLAVTMMARPALLSNYLAVVVRECHDRRPRGGIDDENHSADHALAART